MCYICVLEKRYCSKVKHCTSHILLVTYNSSYLCITCYSNFLSKGWTQQPYKRSNKKDDKNDKRKVSYHNRGLCLFSIDTGWHADLQMKADSDNHLLDAYMWCLWPDDVNWRVWIKEQSSVLYTRIIKHIQ